MVINDLRIVIAINSIQLSLAVHCLHCLPTASKWLHDYRKHHIAPSTDKKYFKVQIQYKVYIQLCIVVLIFELQNQEVQSYEL